MTHLWRATVRAKCYQFDDDKSVVCVESCRSKWLGGFLEGEVLVKRILETQPLTEDFWIMQFSVGKCWCSMSVGRASDLGLEKTRQYWTMNPEKRYAACGAGDVCWGIATAILALHVGSHDCRKQSLHQLVALCWFWMIGVWKRSLIIIQRLQW